MPVKNSKVNNTKTEATVAAPAVETMASVDKVELKTEPVVEQVSADTTNQVDKKVAPKKALKKAAPKKATKNESQPSDSTTVTKECSQETPVNSTAQEASMTPVQVESQTTASELPKQTGGKKVMKKTAAPKKTVKVVSKVVKKAEVENNDNSDDNSERHIRSFKVRLPDKTEFEGRFTGLTPYQAANKALSKYFRETEKPKTEITFSICESTRKSKKTVYTYVGRRQKLDVPVTYKIQDGREIVKNFKNSLKKVKKSEVVTAST